MTSDAEVSIRDARELDVEGLADLNREVQALHLANRPDQFKEPLRDEVVGWFRGLLSNARNRIWIADAGSERAVGYVAVVEHSRAAVPFCPARTWWEIDQIGVRASHRRRGIGRALLAHVSAAARMHDIDVLELNTWAFNQDAHRAFASFGFEAKSIRFELSLSRRSPA